MYAAELSNGIVKVGYSGCPRHRMVLLSHEVSRDFGASLLRFHIGPDLIDRRPFNVETRLIELASEFGAAVEGRREFFHGLTYEVAVALIKGLCDSVPGSDVHAPMVFRSPAKSFAKGDENDFLSRKASERLASWKT